MCAIKFEFRYFSAQNIRRRANLFLYLTTSTRAKRVALLLWLATAFHLAAATLSIPQYKVGETATVDVVSPLHLIVIDHGRTEKVRQQEAQSIPAIFRFDPGAIDQAEAGLRSAFALGREKFLNALEANYSRRKLNEAAVTYPRFQRLVATFQRESTTFPVSTNLAALWATGASDQAIQADLAAKLREIMTHHIIADSLPAEATVGSEEVRMISLKPTEAAPDLGQQTTKFFRTNLYLLAAAREELQASFPPEDKAIGQFLGGFLKENCAFDEELTRQSRSKGVKDLWAASEYERGQIVIKRGDLIDAGKKAVLDQLRERVSADEAKRERTKEENETQTALAQLHAQAARAQNTAQLAGERNRWLLGGMSAALLGFFFVLWRLVRWKRSYSLLPAVRNHEIAGTVISCPACSQAIALPLELTAPASQPPPVALALPETATVSSSAAALTEHWRERALTAERRLEQSGQVLRTALIPHLARWIMNQTIGRLLWQRRHLFETQQRAEQALLELEQRLVAVQAPAEDRLKAYEERIAELEKDLTAKGEENRELIKATIEMARKRMEAERSKERMVWNEVLGPS